MGKVYSHTSKLYRRKSQKNGAYWYSYELVNNIIPAVKTSRPWVTIKLDEFCVDHAIYFIHNNMEPESYRFLKKYKDVIAVVGVPYMVDLIRPYCAHVIYLPLSVDIDFVKKFKARKTKLVCYTGRRHKLNYGVIDQRAELLCDLPRDELLTKMARFRYVYAVGRVAIEAKILGCEIVPYDIRYPDPSLWGIVSNKMAAVNLQAQINKIDHKA